MLKQDSTQSIEEKIVMVYSVGCRYNPLTLPMFVPLKVAGEGERERERRR